MIWKRITEYKIHHVIGWSLYFALASSAYYQFYTNKVDLYLVTSVYVLSHAAMYYVSQYVIAVRTLKKGRSGLFFIFYFLLAVLLSFLMFGAINLILGKDMPRYFGDQFMNIFPVFLISNLFMGGVLIGIKSIIDKSRNQKLEQARQQENLMTELSYLKAQVNPHFLFNTINSVYVLIKIDPDKAAEMLIKLSDLLRSQLYDFSKNKITIEEEIQYLENYIALEKLRKAHRVEVEFSKEGELYDFSMPPLLLIPFLENCFKHLSSNQDSTNIVKINLRKQGSNLLAEFINTYDDELDDNRAGGIGLSNVKRRLALLFPNKYELSIKKNNDFFEVSLKLNLDENEH
ncbi:histidine kinase [Marivirga arenosa]|uniref:Histidine kinase n=1 Tax=Marivirga arenosa TaxID=3059076 RepID=A0AA51N9D0_9BACT|nr:histidine kinase [Marivirga sp. ABR2-2]WMN06915.1 histidine kinase [Marivirga sp. ABR2-2]